MSDHSELFAFPNVVGVGVGFKKRNGKIVRDDAGQPVQAVIVSVVRKIATEDLQDNERVPSLVGDSPTDVIEVGTLSRLDHVDPKRRSRPISAGFSTGLNPGVTAGTIGFIVEKPGSSQNYILSNWHVIATSNVPIEDREVLTVTQPGNADGGRVPDDVVAELSEFVPVGTTLPDLSDCSIAGAVAWIPNAVARLLGSNTRLVPTTGFAIVASEQLVDAALARLSEDANLDTPHVGRLARTGVAELGMSVQKFGRTTRYTTGVVTQVNASFLVQGYPSGPVMFTDQVAIDGDAGPFLQGGDSGSGLVSGDTAVGLCFAGSDVIGIANQWYNVEAALGIVLARS